MILCLKRLEESVQCEFGRTVATTQREAETAGNGGCDGDSATPSANHLREQGLGDGNWGKIIDFHYLAYHLHRCILYIGPLTDAGIEHNYIYAAERQPGLFDKAVDLIQTGKVIWERKYVLRSELSAFSGHSI